MGCFNAPGQTNHGPTGYLVGFSASGDWTNIVVTEYALSVVEPIVIWKADLETTYELIP